MRTDCVCVCGGGTSDLLSKFSGGSRIFPRGGREPSRGGREHAKFSRKLHEIERIWTPRGGRASLTPPPRSANEVLLPFQKKKRGLPTFFPSSTSFPEKVLSQFVDLLNHYDKQGIQMIRLRWYWHLVIHKFSHLLAARHSRFVSKRETYK